MRKPWFQILEVVELRGRSIADITIEVAKRRCVDLKEIRGDRQTQLLRDVRKDVYEQIARERPDLSSEVVGAYLRVDGSTIRRFWRTMPERVNS